MDTYRVKLSNGETVVVQSDHPPTEDEVLRAYQAHHQTETPAEPPVDERTPLQKGIGTALDAGVGLIKGGVKGVGQALAAPVTIPYSIYNKGLMGTAKDMVEGGASQLNDIVHGDAGTRAEALGELAGNVLVPEEVINRGPLAHATARGAGAIVETTGKTAAWPLRITGAHQLASSGNPLGLALMAAPEAVQGLGRRMRRWGEDTPARNQRAIDEFWGGDKPAPVGPQGVTVMPNTPDIVDRGMRAGGAVPMTVDEANTAIMDGLRKKMAESGTVSLSDLRSLRGELARGEKAQLNTENLGKIRSAREGLEPRHTFGETTTATNPEGGVERQSTRYVDPEAEARAQQAKQQQQRTPSEDDINTILAKHGVSPKAIARGNFSVQGQPESAPTFTGRPLEVGPNARALTGSPESSGAGAEPPSALAQQLLQVLDQRRGGAPHEPLALENVTSSRSSRGMSDVERRMSVNDMEALREILAKNPNISDADLAMEIMKRRRGRTDLYRNFPPEPER